MGKNKTGRGPTTLWHVVDGYGQYVVAYGAAITQLGGGSLRPNMRREELAYTGAWERMEFPLAVVCMLAVTLVGVMWILQGKQLNRLEELGLQIESVKGRGYRIPGGIDLLEEDAVSRDLSAQARALLTELDIHQSIGSTNAEAMRRIEMGAGSGLVCTAEQQSAGRGRRSKRPLLRLATPSIAPST